MLGKTKSGFEYDVDKQVFDDMRLLDAVSEIDDNPAKISKVALLVLGKDQKNRLYDHIKLDNGRIPVEKASDEIAEIFNAFGDISKN